jgi:hypothetical protein
MLTPDTLDESKYVWYLKHAINGFRKLNLHSLIGQTIKTKRIPLDPNTNIANLPPDYIDWLKVGVSYKYWNGTCHAERIVNLDYNENMVGVGEQLPTCTTCECTPENFNQVVNNDPAQYGWQTWLYYAPRVNNGQFTSGVYGIGQNIFRGGFIVDVPNNIIRVGSFVSNVMELVLEYKATGIDDTGDAIIPEGAIPALTAYVQWMSNLEQGKLQMAREYMAIFNTEALALNMRDCALTEKDWFTLMRESIKQVPKS